MKSIKGIDIVNQKIGMLNVTGETKKTPKTKFFKCVCDCGNIRFHTKQNLLKGTIKSCGCFKLINKGKIHKNWKGYGEISASFFIRLKEIAKRRKIKFNLNIKFLSDLYEKQKRKCAISGLEITFPLTWKESHKFNYTCSLDRIDSSKEYTKDNVQWVHKNINMMKQQFEEKYFISLCNEISKFNKKETICTI
jgi:hypothetical protein